jgi:hypothetical protein
MALLNLILLELAKIIAALELCFIRIDNSFLFAKLETAFLENWLQRMNRDLCP